MKVRVVLFMAVLAAFLFTFSQCKSRKPERKVHDFASVEEFKKLSRQEQVKKCAACHKDVYENEMLGPHANAFINLKAHMDFVHSDRYDGKVYKTLMEKEKDMCFDCHASKNLYETVFKTTADDYDIRKNVFGIKAGPKQRDENDRLTGIDCMACHFDGEGVIAGEKFKLGADSSKCPSYCSPVGSKFFSSVTNCQPCHPGQERNVMKYNYTNHTNLTCAGCHEEKDSLGRPTHYMYWAHNPANKPLPPWLNMFTGINASYVQDKNEIKVVWKNNLMPHEVSICTELVAFIEVSDNGKVVRYDTIRLNLREQHAKLIQKHFGVTDFPGVNGYALKTINDSLVKFIPLPQRSSSASDLEFTIKGIKKEQYWLDDSIHTNYFNKSFRL